MKKFINIVLLIFLMGAVSSCLKSGLDDLDTYSDAEITNLKFEYRWWNDDKQQMAVQEISIEKQISTDDNLITCKLTVPAVSANFTADIRQEVSLSKLYAFMDISTAARIAPVNGAPTLGKAADFSAKEFKYLVTAADGTKREWTIKITDFIK